MAGGGGSRRPLLPVHQKDGGSAKQTGARNSLPKTPAPTPASVAKAKADSYAFEGDLNPQTVSSLARALASNRNGPKTQSLKTLKVMHTRDLLAS